MNEHIVMIHGMTCGDWVWNAYKDYFHARGHRCITPNLRHHGKQGDPVSNGLGKTSLLDYVQDLEDEIRRLDEKPVLIGHSMGGLLAQLLGSRGLAKALVLLAPAAPWGVLALRYSVLKSVWSSLTTPGFWNKPMMPSFSDAEYAMLHLMTDEKKKDIYARLVPESGRTAFEIGFWLLDRKRAAAVESARLTCPTLFIAGGQDRLVPASVVRSIASRYQGATLKEYPDNAHWLFEEPGWESIMEYSANWLDEVLTRLPQRPQAPVLQDIGFGERIRRRIAHYKPKDTHPHRLDERAYRRRDSDLAVTANIPFSGNAQFYQIGRTVNISQGGIFVDTDLRIPEGTYLNVHLVYNGADRPLWGQCQETRTSCNGLALRFSHVESEKLKTLAPA